MQCIIFNLYDFSNIPISHCLSWPVFLFDSEQPGCLRSKVRNALDHLFAITHRHSHRSRRSEADVDKHAVSLRDSFFTPKGRVLFLHARESITLSLN